MLVADAEPEESLDPRPKPLDPPAMVVAAQARPYWLLRQSQRWGRRVGRLASPSTLVQPVAVADEMLGAPLMPLLPNFPSAPAHQTAKRLSALLNVKSNSVTGRLSRESWLS